MSNTPHRRNRLLTQAHASVASAALLALCAGSVGAAGKTYTLDVDFSLDCSKTRTSLRPIPTHCRSAWWARGSKYLFIANHDEDTVFKFGTLLNTEVARYRTYAGSGNGGGNPSRIAIDVDGNAYVLNREPSHTAPPQLFQALRYRGGRAGNAVNSKPNGGAAKHKPDGTLLWTAPQQDSGFKLEVMIDGNNGVWVMNLDRNNMSKYRGTDGAALGTFPVGADP